MAKKLLVPVLPSDRFYDAVVAAGDIVASEGGLVTFLFTEVRPPSDAYSDDEDGRPSELDVAVDSGERDARDLEAWRQAQISALDDARQILYERGVGDDRIDYQFADFADHESAAQAIADEAAAGAYDLVVLAKGYFEDEVSEEGSPPAEITDTIQKELGDDGVRVIVT